MISALRLDRRVLKEIEENGTITDIRIIRAIRKYDEAEEGKSDKQHELYQKIIAENMTRDAVQKYIKKTTRKTVKKPVMIKWSKAGKAVIRIGGTGIDKAKKKEFEEKVNALIDKYLGKEKE